MIRDTDNPAGTRGVVKFIDEVTGEGHRGALCALAHDARGAIVRALTTSFDGTRVRRGELYRVEEHAVDEYPKLVAAVSGIPADGTFRVYP